MDVLAIYKKMNVGGNAKSIFNCLVILAIIFQGLALFTTHIHKESPALLALEELAKLPGVSLSKPIICLNDNDSPEQTKHSIDCPMCQIFGHFELPKLSQNIFLIFTPDKFNYVLVKSNDQPLLKINHRAVSPRGPPVLV
jgi:hypothetical protein